MISLPIATDELTDEQRSASDCASQVLAQWVTRQTAGAQRHMVDEHSVEAEIAAQMAAATVITGALMAAVALAKASGLTADQFAEHVASAWTRITAQVVLLAKGGDA